MLTALPACLRGGLQHARGIAVNIVRLLLPQPALTGQQGLAVVVDLLQHAPAVYSRRFAVGSARPLGQTDRGIDQGLCIITKPGKAMLQQRPGLLVALFCDQMRKLHHADAKVAAGPALAEIALCICICGDAQPFQTLPQAKLCVGHFRQRFGILLPALQTLLILAQSPQAAGVLQGKLTLLWIELLQQLHGLLPGLQIHVGLQHLLPGFGFVQGHRIGRVQIVQSAVAITVLVIIAGRQQPDFRIAGVGQAQLFQQRAGAAQVAALQRAAGLLQVGWHGSFAMLQGNRHYKENAAYLCIRQGTWGSEQGHNASTGTNADSAVMLRC